MRIRAVKRDDLPTLQEIERAAGAQFVDIGMDYVAEQDPPSVETLATYQRDGRAWAQVDEADRPVAYLIADLVDGRIHIEQVSVNPAFAGQRLGRGLIDHVARWARRQGGEALTLVTFTNVAWNGPYYEQCGFRFLADWELTPGLRRIRADEADHGLDQWPRACMLRPL